jgi:tRNA U34 5-carboxymethylaminomethyl modifying GTPase MnmE/TrmE
MKSRAESIIDDIFKDAQDHLKKDFKILIIGSLGAGKSSFLNFLTNAKNSIQNINGKKSCSNVIKDSLENPESSPIA